MSLVIRSARGATLVEALMALMILAAGAMVIYPLLFRAKANDRAGELKSICESVARGKLQNYMTGMPVRIYGTFAEAGAYSTQAIGAAVAGARINFSQLTMPPTIYSGGVSNRAGFLTGFAYSKIRYNVLARPGMFFDTRASTAGSVLSGAIGPLPGSNGNQNLTIPVCGQQAGVQSSAFYGVLTAAGAREYDGVRECIGTDQAWSPGAFPTVNRTVCNSEVDQRVLAQIPDFELYVRIELEPSYLMPGIVAGNPIRNYFDARCPWRRRADPEPVYDFDGAGDGIRVTVTGRYSTKGVRDMLGIRTNDVTAAQIRARDQSLSENFMCRVTGVVRDRKDPIRYLMTSSGEFFTASYRDSDSQVGTAKVLAGLGTGVKSFSVHPRGAGMYALRNGYLTRYGYCHANVAGTSFYPFRCLNGTGVGVGDDGTLRAGNSTQEWAIDAAISHILVDYRNGVVYGLSEDRRSLFHLMVGGVDLPAAYLSQNCNVGNALPACKVTAIDVGGALVSNIVGQTSGFNLFLPTSGWPAAGTGGGGTFALALQQIPDRVTTMALSPFGDTAWLAAPMQMTVDGESTDGTALYNSWDYDLTMPVHWFEDTVAAMSP